jgi:hypothetical protein
VQWRARGGDLRGSIVDNLQEVLWWSGIVGVKGWGVLNTEFTEDVEGRRRGGKLKMGIGTSKLSVNTSRLPSKLGPSSVSTSQLSVNKHGRG